MISSRVIILVLWHVGAHPQVINPTLSLTTEFSKIHDQQVWIPPLETLTETLLSRSETRVCDIILWYYDICDIIILLIILLFTSVKCYITFKLLFLFVKEKIYINLKYCGEGNIFFGPHLDCWDLVKSQVVLLQELRTHAAHQGKHSRCWGPYLLQTFQ